MSQRNRPSILDDAANRHAWQETDPGSLTLPLKQRKPEPECHCPVLGKNEIGGMQPAVDLEARQVKCRVCLRPIGNGCRRASVRHLRGLLKAKPEHVDWDSIPDLLL